MENCAECRFIKSLCPFGLFARKCSGCRQREIQEMTEIKTRVMVCDGCNTDLLKDRNYSKWILELSSVFLFGQVEIGKQRELGCALHFCNSRCLKKWIENKL
jgi:hypothetical protein